jgi:protein TonB
MSLRYPVAIMLACIVTLFLFWVMQALVNTTGELTKAIRTPSVDFVRLRKDNTPEVKKRAPPKKEKPDAPPPPPDISMSKARLDPGGAVASISPAIDPGDALAGGIQSGGGSDREAVPLVRIAPEYPMRARQRNIEGWVHVKFTITKAGTVKDVVVLDSHPGTIFDKAAVRAVAKWKYNPKIENGAAIERRGQTTVVDFSME